MKALNRYNLILNLAASALILGSFAAFCVSSYNVPNKNFLIEFLVMFIPTALLCLSVSKAKLYAEFQDYGFILLAPLLVWNAAELLTTLTGVAASLLFVYMQYKAITKEDHLVYSNVSEA